MIGRNKGIFASLLFALCFMFASPAQAQLNNPADCPSFNRNWQCTAIANYPEPFTVCVQVVRGGVVVDQRNRTFNGEAAFNRFLQMAPAGTTYQQCGATPSCTQTTETRNTTPCPAGQTGVITETRTLNTGGVCNATSAWTVVSNTCGPCTQTTETQTVACPSGQIGEIIRTRTINTGGVCGAISQFVETSNTCRVPPSTVCVNPFGGTLQVGQSIIAYETSNGLICRSETRTCLPNGTLSGSYTQQNCTVTCTQGSETRTNGQQCPAGQQGVITETRTTNTGGVCGAFGQWTVVSNTCTPVCTQTTETRTNGQQCPAGQSGVITETRTVNTGGVCGSNSAWTVVSNTCTPNVCQLPWGGTINVGESVTAYKKVTVVQAATTNTSATVINSLCAIARTTNLYVSAGTCSDIPAGVTDPTGNGAATTTTQYCLSETRTCLPNGTLSGSYTERTCSANPSCTQTTETRTNGQQCPSGQTGVITETRTVNTGGVCGANSAWSVVSNTCQPPASCTLPWGGTIASGQSVTAYLESNVGFGGTCFFETRVCNNGVLSGSYTKQTCVIGQPQSCNLPWGGTIANGQSVTAYRLNGTVCESETRTCSNGNLSGSYTAQTCVVPPQSCTTPWGATVANGQSVTAYKTSTTPFGTVCESQTRTCSNGTLSGTFTHQNCSVNPAASCTTPWGATVANGQSVTAYRTNTTPFGSVCESQTRTCSNGTLSGTFTYQNCSMTPAASCTLPNGQVIASGQSVVFYQSANPPQGTACAGETRTCNNGSLSGSFTNTTCSQVICSSASTSNTNATACTTTGYTGGTQTGSNTVIVNASQEQAQATQQSQNGPAGSQSQAASQAEQQNINVQVTGNASVNVQGTQEQAQAAQQTQTSSSSSGTHSQSQALSQAQQQELMVWINSLFGR